MLTYWLITAKKKHKAILIQEDREGFNDKTEANWQYNLNDDNIEYSEVLLLTSEHEILRYKDFNKWMNSKGLYAPK